MTAAWSNDATFAIHQHLGSAHYGELMQGSRQVWHGALFRNDEVRSTDSLQLFAQFLHGAARWAQLEGDLVGVDLDKVDFLQIANHWLTEIDDYKGPVPS